MKTPLYFLLLALIGLNACRPPSPSEASGTATTTSSPEAAAAVVTLSVQDFAAKSSGGTLLDVRTAGEVAQGKIEGAQVIDYYNSDFLQQVSKISKDQEVYIYCAVGARSEEAAALLIQQGYTKVYHLRGGIQAWRQEGMEINLENFLFKI